MLWASYQMTGRILQSLPLYANFPTMSRKPTHTELVTHSWSNFEIADLDFWRSEAYQKFFDYLESKGGFYYEVSEPITSSASLLSHLSQRWGDAPIHSIAAGLFANKDQLHFFRDIGYKHEFSNTVLLGRNGKRGNALVIPTTTSVRHDFSGTSSAIADFLIDYAVNSCLPKYNALFS